MLYLQYFNDYLKLLRERIKPENAPMFPHFTNILKMRLDNGYRTYGDGSFTEKEIVLVDQLSGEAADITGWGIMTWVRTKNNPAIAERVLVIAAKGYDLWVEIETLKQEMFAKAAK